MAPVVGFSDSIIVKTYSGSSRNEDISGDPCFKIPQPDWYAYAKVTITADSKNDLPWIKERLASSGEIVSDGSFLYIYPAEMLDWFNPDEYGRYSFTLYRRVASAQEFEPADIRQFNLPSLVEQENTNVRLSQEAMEMARRGLHFPPGEFPDFSGEETIVPESAIPPVNVRRGRLLGFHPTTGAPALYDASGYIGDPVSVDVVVPKAELQGQQFFKYDTGGAVEDATVTWVVSVYGFIPDTYTWYVKTGSTWNIIPGETQNQIILFNEDYPEVCTVKVVAMNATYFAEDSMSLVKLRDGSGSYTVIIDNQVMPVQCDQFGAPVSGEIGPASDSNFTVYVYHGTVELNAVTASPGAGQFRIESILGGTTYIKPLTASKFYLDDFESPKVITFTVNCESLASLPKAVSWSKAIEGSATYVVIESTNGNIFHPGQSLTTDLNARVFDGTGEITATISASNFRWRRVSKIQPSDDATWNSSHNSGYKSVTVTTTDVIHAATFFCDILT